MGSVRMRTPLPGLGGQVAAELFAESEGGQPSRWAPHGPRHREVSSGGKLILSAGESPQASSCPIPHTLQGNFAQRKAQRRADGKGQVRCVLLREARAERKKPLGGSRRATRVASLTP